MMKIAINKELLRSVISIASVIEARDPYTGGHTWRVSEYAVLLKPDRLTEAEYEVMKKHPSIQ